MSYTYVSLSASSRVCVVIVTASPTPSEFAPSLPNALSLSSFHLMQRGGEPFNSWILAHFCDGSTSNYQELNPVLISLLSQVLHRILEAFLFSSLQIKSCSYSICMWGLCTLAVFFQLMEFIILSISPQKSKQVL